MQRFANALKGLGVERGDRVAIYMPMIPELPMALLACARIGAAHSVVFGGFSADSLSDRINDAEAKVLITADGGWRRGQAALLKPTADVALADTPSITGVVVVQRTGASGDDAEIPMTEGRDHWYHDLVAAADAECPAEPMDSEQLLYLLYTSGTTAKPKGIMHTTGGYLTQVAFTHKYVFDIHPETDVYWCAADVGWVTGHSYIVYGPLANGVTPVVDVWRPDVGLAVGHLERATPAGVAAGALRDRAGAEVAVEGRWAACWPGRERATAAHLRGGPPGGSLPAAGRGTGG